jgi:hypothetical protein
MRNGISGWYLPDLQRGSQRSNAHIQKLKEVQNPSHANS